MLSLCGSSPINMRLADPARFFRDQGTRVRLRSHPFICVVLVHDTVRLWGSDVTTYPAVRTLPPFPCWALLGMTLTAPRVEVDRIS